MPIHTHTHIVAAKLLLFFDICKYFCKFLHKTHRFFHFLYIKKATTPCGIVAFVSIIMPRSDEDQLHDDIYRQEDDQAELNHIAEEGRHIDTLLLSDRLHHGVRSGTDICQRTKEDGTHRDGLEEGIGCQTDYIARRSHRVEDHSRRRII